MAEKSDFGTTTDGRAVSKYTLSNGAMVVRILDLGATICSVQVPDAKGNVGEVCLGYDELKPYLDWTTNPYFGAVAGRCANRICKGKFKLDGVEYQLETNNGPNHLHGGNVGFDKKIWTVEKSSPTDLVLSLVSPDGDEHYPGTVTAKVTYSLPQPNQLCIEYEATTDKPTIINLTNHSYWNLADGGISSILDHEIELFADFYTPVDDTSIPFGEIREVTGAMDLRKKVKIGQGIKDADNGLGYDHNYILRGSVAYDVPAGLQPVAKVSDSSSGRWMAVFTDQPGVQFYTGNYLNGFAGRTGKPYEKHHGFCLETQRFPDAANRSHFSPVVLRPGETYRHHTRHEFGVA